MKEQDNFNFFVSMTYAQTISFLFDQLPVYQKVGEQAIKKDLRNIIALCEALGNPQNNWPSIHVAGTNGKGTVTHMIAAGVQAAGHKVGVYTSPHYVDFRERIKINGECISEDYVTNFVIMHQQLIKQIEPSFFEITVAMAFQYFADEQVDYAVIETGLGGRLDSTNILSPKLSVITNIGLDHKNMLGNTIYQIAHEKAGIIKPETPVIIGLYQSACDVVFLDKARRMNSALIFASLTSESAADSEDQHLSPFYQENRHTALIALQQLVRQGHISLEDSLISEALDQFKLTTNYIGRWQILAECPQTIADSAHNVAALKEVIERLLSMNYRTLRMVLGFVKGKDIEAVIKLLPKEAIYYLVQPQIFRAIPVSDLDEMFADDGLRSTQYQTVAQGYEYALSEAHSEDLVYIGGSSFVVGDLLAYLAKS